MEKDKDSDYNFIHLLWASIYCESKIEKQDLQAGKR